MKPFNRLYSVAAAVAIYLLGVPAQAASAPEATLVRIVAGRAQFGVAQSPPSDRVVEGLVATMTALRTRSTDRLYWGNSENAPFPTVRPITTHARQTKKP